MSDISGPNASRGRPSEEWITRAREWTARAFEGGDYRGLDVRGRTRDGRYWRYVGQFGEEFSYYGVDEDAARFFDSIIAGGCVHPVIVKAPPN